MESLLVIVPCVVGRCNMKILVLEDDCYRVRFFVEKFGQHDITITENSFDAITHLENEVFDLIFLDHDLGEDNGDGFDVAVYLFDNPWNVNNRAEIIIHSWNIPATKRMLSKISQAIHMPFNVVDFSIF